MGEERSKRRKKPRYEVRKVRKDKFLVLFLGYEVPIERSGGFWDTPFHTPTGVEIYRPTKIAAIEAVVEVIWKGKHEVEIAELVGKGIIKSKDKKPLPVPEKEDSIIEPVEEINEQMAKRLEEIEITTRKGLKEIMFRVTEVHFRVGKTNFVYLAPTTVKLIGEKQCVTYQGFADRNGNPVEFEKLDQCRDSVAGQFGNWLKGMELPEETMDSINGRIKRRRIFIYQKDS